MSDPTVLPFRRLLLWMVEAALCWVVLGAVAFGVWRLLT